MEMGADDYLTKPFDGIELLNAIEIRLKKSQDHSEITSGVIGLNDFIDQAYRAGLIRLTSNEREIVDYQKKHVIYKEDQRPRFLYYIVRGKIKVYKKEFRRQRINYQYP